MGHRRAKSDERQQPAWSCLCARCLSPPPTAAHAASVELRVGAAAQVPRQGAQDVQRRGGLHPNKRKCLRYESRTIDISLRRKGVGNAALPTRVQHITRKRAREPRPERTVQSPSDANAFMTLRTLATTSSERPWSPDSRTHLENGREGAGSLQHKAADWRGQKGEGAGRQSFSCSFSCAEQVAAAGTGRQSALI